MLWREIGLNLDGRARSRKGGNLSMINIKDLYTAERKELTKKRLKMLRKKISLMK